MDTLLSIPQDKLASIKIKMVHCDL